MRGLRLVLVTALLLGCGDGAVAPGGDATGLYSLRSVNGKAVPYEIVGGPGQGVEITTRTLFLRSDGTFLDRVMLRFTEGDVSLETVASREGLFRFSSPDLTLDDENGWGASGRLDRGVLTVNDGGVIFELTR